MTEEEKCYKIAQTILIAARALRIRNEMFAALKDEINNFILETIGFDREDRIIYESLLSKINEGTKTLDIEQFDLNASERLLELVERKLKRYTEKRET